MNNLAINNSIEIYQFVFHKQKIHISYFIISIKIWQLIFLSKKLIHAK